MPDKLFTPSLKRLREWQASSSQSHLGDYLKGLAARLQEYAEQKYWEVPGRQRPLGAAEAEELAARALEPSQWRPYENVLHIGGSFVELVGRSAIRFLDPTPLRHLIGINIPSVYQRMTRSKERPDAPSAAAILGLIAGAQHLEEHHTAPQYMFHASVDGVEAGYVARNGSHVIEVLVAYRKPHAIIALSDEHEHIIKIHSTRRGYPQLPPLEEMLAQAPGAPYLRTENDFPFADWNAAARHRKDIKASIAQALYGSVEYSPRMELEERSSDLGIYQDRPRSPVPTQ